MTRKRTVVRGAESRVQKPAERPDGIAWSAEHELELNRLAAATFRTADGQKFLDYLKNITINHVQGPAVTDGELRHIEGQRYIVAIIERRANLGRERK